MRTILFLSIFVLIVACEDEPFNPNYHIPGSEELAEMIDYQIMAIDCVYIYATDEAYFEEKHFKEVVISQIKNFVELVPLDTITPIYNIENDAYKLEINTTLIIPENNPTYDINFRFYLNDLDYRSVNISIQLYKYPFESSTLFFNYGQYFSSGFIQGFQIYNGDLYFRPSGPSGIYKYSLSRSGVEEVYGPMSSGDWFAIYEDTLYIDFSHENIVKVEIGGDWSDVEYIIDNDVWDIRGLDISKDTLYVLNYENGNYLSKFDLKGTLISTEPFDYNGWSIAINGNYLYAFTLGNDIIRYHLYYKTYEVLYEDLEIELESINVIGNTLYYSDYNKQIICYLPLSDILN